MNEVARLTLHRRQFLQAALATGAASLVPDWLRFGEAQAATPVAANEGILVLIMLAGGNDGLNTVIPVDAGRYHDLRKGLAISRPAALDIGSGLALHPSLPNLKRRFDQRMVNIVQGVGYPNSNLSHFDAMADWMAGWGGGSRPSSGWLGRWLDGLPSPDSLRLVSIGGNVPPHLRGDYHSGVSLPSSMSDAFGVNRSDGWRSRMIDLVDSYGSAPSDRGAWADQLGQLGHTTVQLAGQVSPAYTGLDGDGVVRDLKLTARLINANVGVRVFSVELGGFDTHGEQATAHASLLSDLDNGIEAFFATLDPHFASRVTLMTFSEFGRRPEVNGSGGTDHGTASPLFVIGSGVKGGLYSSMPSLTALDQDDNFVATCDFRQVYASMLTGWLAAPSDPILGHHFDAFDFFRFAPGGPGLSAGGSSRATNGYWTTTSTGVTAAFGSAANLGNAPAGVTVVGMAATPGRDGYWLVTPQGAVYPFGGAQHFGDMHGRYLASPIVGMAATVSGLGYWLLGRDGGIFSFGDATFYGSTGNLHLAAPVVAMAATPSGKGYWFVATDGGVFAYGDAQFFGSTGTMHLNSPVVSMAATATGKGYWLVAADGGVFAYGDATFYGSTGSMKLNSSVIGIVPTASGKGYWFVAADGGVFAYGDAPFLGSSAGAGLVVTAMA
jgi:uncharacterized protein (DUF1501 family)